MRKFLIACITLLGLLGAAAYYGQQRLLAWQDEAQALSEPVVFEFPRGRTLSALSRELEKQQLVTHGQVFKLWVKYFSDYSRFQAGTYRFEDSVTPRSLAEKMISGDVFTPVVLEYTIPEGFTYSQTAARLVGKGVGTIEVFDALFKDQEFISSLGIAAPTLEGYLYPATYRFSEVPTPQEAIREAVDVFKSRLPEGYAERAKEFDITLEDAVIIASLIELETAHDDERSMVSEVIWSRLRKGAALAIDASIIYGIPDYNGNLTRKHLRDRSNPYNTRIHPGLPPTAIGSPSRASLEAVFEPSDFGYYYYVLDLETGRHTFSKTLKEHNSHVRKLVRETRRRRIEERRKAADARREAKQR